MQQIDAWEGAIDTSLGASPPADIEVMTLIPVDGV